MIFDRIRWIGLSGSYLNSEIKSSSFRLSRESGNPYLNIILCIVRFPLPARRPAQASRE